MKSTPPLVIKAAMIACLSLCWSHAYAEQKGQDFPSTKCTCKGCGKNPTTGAATDVTGQCATVCKDKTVYSKGSESYDYCKAAARTRIPRQPRPDAPKAPLDARP
ncbi:hypothetical protein [Pseudoxanthomonas gei]|nr:hypothetical protein [Pseudoxanthomonas gei]